MLTTSTGGVGHKAVPRAGLNRIHAQATSEPILSLLLNHSLVHALDRKQRGLWKYAANVHESITMEIANLLGRNVDTPCHDVSNTRTPMHCLHQEMPNRKSGNRTEQNSKTEQNRTEFCAVQRSPLRWGCAPIHTDTRTRTGSSYSVWNELTVISLGGALSWLQCPRQTRAGLHKHTTWKGE